MPYHTMSKESRDDIWDDGLHFTPKGYGVMGNHIANRLIELVRAISEEGKTEGDSKNAEN
jgi:lysophospholipase L1-like esterase